MKKDNYDIVTVIIATYNSEKILGKVLEALRKQSYPQEYIEKIIIDGGSTDGTRRLASKYGCRIVDNPKTEPVYAKLLGMQNAKGKYLITVDHDEVFENKDSIKIRVEALNNHKECKVAFCSGYKRPDKYPALNQYISEFGDPFSLFMYNFSKDWKFYGNVLKNNYRLLEENEEYIRVSFDDLKKMPIIELCCMGTMIDLEYFKSVTNILTDSTDMVHLFYIMLDKGVRTVILTKDDPLVHYSVDSLKAYFPKLKWRICNNVHFQEKGEKGFNGRLKYQKSLQFKKFLFIPYSIFFPISFVHGALLACSRKNGIYLMHPLFCLYVVFQIIYQMCLKLMKKTPEFTSYDGKKRINR